MELGDRATERLLVAEIGVERGERLVDELNDSHASLRAAIAELAPATAVERHRDRHDRAISHGPARPRRPQVAKHFRDDVACIPRAPAAI